MDKDKLKKELGFKIKVERMRQKISQEKLAEMADCSLSYIGFVFTISRSPYNVQFFSMNLAIIKNNSDAGCIIIFSDNRLHK